MKGDDPVLILQREEQGVDVVLSDIWMPGAIDGVALAEPVRRVQASVAVVLKTGYFS